MSWILAIACWAILVILICYGFAALGWHDE